MKTKTTKTLPKTESEIKNGGVYVQRIRCGKSNCKCACGEAHTAFYFFSRNNKGKLIKTYIRKSELKAFSELAAQALEARKEARRKRIPNRFLLKLLRQLERAEAARIKRIWLGKEPGNLPEFMTFDVDKC